MATPQSKESPTRCVFRALLASIVTSLSIFRSLTHCLKAAIDKTLEIARLHACFSKLQVLYIPGAPWRWPLSFKDTPHSNLSSSPCQTHRNHTVPTHFSTLPYYPLLLGSTRPWYFRQNIWAPSLSCGTWCQGIFSSLPARSLNYRLS